MTANKKNLMLPTKKIPQVNLFFESTQVLCVFLKERIVPKVEYVLGELFCGPGGLALGAKLATPQVAADGTVYSIRHAWGVDIDPISIETYRQNGLGTGVVSDAMDFSLGKSRGPHNSPTILDFERISGLAFGFPCNDFSLVGKQRGFQGKYGSLYRAGINALNHASPDWFIAENVSGIHSSDSGRAFKKILAALEDSGKYGYNITAHLYRFEDYGVPQYRHRYIIVGISKHLNVSFKVPPPTHIGKHVSAQTALDKPYDCPSGNFEQTRQSPRVINRLLLTPPGKNAWFLDELATLPVSQIRNQLSGLPWYKARLKHLSDASLLELLESSRLRCTKARMSHIYRRLSAEKPSYTLTGSGGGGTHVYHWEECRALTNRERARLQDFPDDFIFAGPKEHVRKQIGMAVPPRGAKVIFEHILKTMARIP